MQQNIRPEIKKDIDKFGFCILNQTHDEYNVEKGFIRSSEIKNILIDVPAMVKYSLDNPSEKDSRDLVIGSAFDSLVFGREEFEDRFVCFEDKLKPFPNSDYRNKENVSARDKFIASNLPKITLYEKEVDTIEAMYSALKGNESARKIIDNCLPHCNIYWFDAELGCYFKCEIGRAHV